MQIDGEGPRGVMRVAYFGHFSVVLHNSSSVSQSPCNLQPEQSFLIFSTALVIHLRSFSLASTTLFILSTLAPRSLLQFCYIFIADYT